VAIGVTGASGGVGSRVIIHLLAGADPPHVVALARRPSAVPEVANQTVRFADYDDPSSLCEAFTDLRTLVFISSDGVAETMRRHHEHVIAAASDAGVDHIVYTSIIDVSPDSGFYYAVVHRETEALLSESGLSHCLARTSIFADYFLSTWIAPAFDEGTLALPAGDGRMSLVTRDDVARALAVAAVSRCEGVIELTGPAALTAGEISQITEAATGRRLRYRALEEGAYRRRLAGDQAPGWLTEAFSTMFASVREGRFELVSSDIPELTGEPQQPYTEFIRSVVLEPATGDEFRTAAPSPPTHN
jgi:NAD(P)H dehydrogenase (quinone)